MWTNFYIFQEVEKGFICLWQSICMQCKFVTLSGIWLLDLLTTITIPTEVDINASAGAVCVVKRGVKMLSLGTVKCDKFITTAVTTFRHVWPMKLLEFCM